MAAEATDVWKRSKYPAITLLTHPSRSLNIKTRHCERSSFSWVQQDAPDAVKLDIAPPGYNVVHAHRKSNVAKRSGGLAVIYRDNIRVKSSINTGIPFAEFELLVITVCCSQRSVDIVVIYRPPGPVSSFITEFSDLLDYLHLSGSQSIIGGDLTVLAAMEKCMMIIWMMFCLLIT